MDKIQSTYDVVIIGGGHNGLVAAAYLGRAGLRVLLLERNSYLGGATTSQPVFPAYEAYLSRYSYLVSLLPRKIVQDLNLSLDLRRRSIASFTPYLKDSRHRGLLLSNENETVSRTSVDALAGNPREYQAYQQMLARQQVFAQKVWHSFLQPLPGKADLQKQFGTPEEKVIWNGLVEEPLGNWLENQLQDDVLRGVVCTDAKIGAFTHPHDPSLLQNRTYIYHVIGNESGEWRVPAGGMQSLVNALVRRAEEANVQCLTGAEVNGVVTGKKHSVFFVREGKEYEVNARYLLVNAAPAVLARLLNATHQPLAEDEGSVVKINMLLHKLPRVKAAGISPAEAFAGTFHINQRYSQMQTSYKQAAAGQLPDALPAEIYCHTLTDTSILSPELAGRGYHTLTLFGLDVPYALFERDAEATKQAAVRRYLHGLNEFLEEPIEECMAADARGNPCIEAKSPVDIERELQMPRGNIFHNALSWFFAQTPGEIGSWGVETEHHRVYICGSGARRGGAVSGIPGHNAAMRVLSDEGLLG